MNKIETQTPATVSVAFTTPKSTNIVTSTTNITTTEAITTIIISEKFPEKLQKAIDINPECAFYVRSLDDSKTYFYNKDKIFYLASTIKVAVALYAFKDADAGNCNLNTNLEYKITSEEGEISYGMRTLKEHIYQILYVSDNDSYHALRDFFGKEQINDFIRNMGLSTFIIGENSPSGNWAYGTPYDAFLLWENVYIYKNSGENGEYLFDILTHTMFDYIADYLGQKYLVAEKYGKMDDLCGLNGIIFSEKPYYFMYYLAEDFHSEENNAYEVLNEIDILMNN